LKRDYFVVAEEKDYFGGKVSKNLINKFHYRSLY